MQTSTKTEMKNKVGVTYLPGDAQVRSRTVVFLILWRQRSPYMVGGSEGWMRILPFYMAFILSFDEVGAWINSARQAAANQLQDSAPQRDERLLSSFRRFSISLCIVRHFWSNRCA